MSRRLQTTWTCLPLELGDEETTRHEASRGKGTKQQCSLNIGRKKQCEDGIEKGQLRRDECFHSGSRRKERNDAFTDDSCSNIV